MKEATGDMTMTIVVIVSVIAILAIAPTIWNMISGKIQDEVNNIDTPAFYVEEIDNYYI